MALLDILLEPPTYGWQDNEGNLVKPKPSQLIGEFFFRLNVFRDKKNWLPFLSWLSVACLFPFLVVAGFWLLAARRD